MTKIVILALDERGDVIALRPGTNEVLGRQAVMQDIDGDAVAVRTAAAELVRHLDLFPEDEAECPRCGGPLASDRVCADDSCGDTDPVRS